MRVGDAEWRGILGAGARAIGFCLNDRQLDQFARIARELLLWNRKINLTAITDPVQVAVKHFIDSMAPARDIDDHSRVLDIGSGPGFPALPLKILNPSLRIVLVDASRKKTNFVRQVVRQLSLNDIEALNVRTEALARDADHRAVYDAVVSRAFSRLDVFLNAGWPFVRPGGRLIAMKGRLSESELATLRSAVEAMTVDGSNISGPLRIATTSYVLPISGDDRTLVTIASQSNPH